MPNKINNNPHKLSFHIPLPTKMEMPTIVRIAEKYLNFSSQQTTLQEEKNSSTIFVKIEPKKDNAYQNIINSLKGISFILFPLPLIALAVKAIYRHMNEVYIAQEIEENGSTETIDTHPEKTDTTASLPSMTKEQIDNAKMQLKDYKNNMDSVDSMIDRLKQVDPLSNRDAADLLHKYENRKSELEYLFNQLNESLPEENRFRSPEIIDETQDPAPNEGQLEENAPASEVQLEEDEGQPETLPQENELTNENQTEAEPEEAEIIEASIEEVSIEEVSAEASIEEPQEAVEYSYEDGLKFFTKGIKDHLGEPGEDVAKVIEMFLTPLSDKIKHFLWVDDAIEIVLKETVTFQKGLSKTTVSADKFSFEFSESKDGNKGVAFKGISIDEEPSTLDIKVAAEQTDIYWNDELVTNLPPSEIINNPILPNIISDFIASQQNEVVPTTAPKVERFLSDMAKVGEDAKNIFGSLCTVLGNKIKTAKVLGSRSDKFEIELTSNMRFWVPIADIPGLSPGIVLAVGPKLKGDIVTNRNGSKTIKFTDGIEITIGSTWMAPKISPKLEFAFQDGKIKLIVGALLLSKTIELPEEATTMLKFLNEFLSSSESTKEFISEMIEKYNEKETDTKKLYAQKQT